MVPGTVSYALFKVIHIWFHVWAFGYMVHMVLKAETVSVIDTHGFFALRHRVPAVDTYSLWLKNK